LRVIIRFPAQRDASAFVDALVKARPQLAEHIRIAKSASATVTIHSLTQQDRDTVASLLQPDARVFDDVQFEPFNG
jgi:hypothetical protein